MRPTAFSAVPSSGRLCNAVSSQHVSEGSLSENETAAQCRRDVLKPWHLGDPVLLSWTHRGQHGPMSDEQSALRTPFCEPAPACERAGGLRWYLRAGVQPAQGLCGVHRKRCFPLNCRPYCS